MLDGDGIGPVNNLVVMSEVAPATAPPGRSLVSVTVLGARIDASLEAEVVGQLEGWFGDAVHDWRLLRRDVIERALPDQRPPRPGRATARLERGIYVCGDHRADGSINGAMASGRAAAEALLDDLGLAKP